MKSFEPVKQKISANPKQNISIPIPQNNYITNSNTFQQPGYPSAQTVNLTSNGNSQMKILNSSGGMEKMMMPLNRFSEQPVYRNMEISSATSGNQPMYTPTMSEMIQGRPLERSTASNLNKKSKKIGLKLLTTSDGEQNVLQNV